LPEELDPERNRFNNPLGADRTGWELSMLVSFGLLQRAILTLAILSASATAAFCDCKELLDKFNQALESRALSEMTRLEAQIAGEADCGGRLVEVQRRRTALQLLLAQEKIDKGAALADYEALVVDADRPQVQWRAAKALGDMRFIQRRFDEATRAYERALEIIKNPSKTPSDPGPQAIEAVFDLATRSRMLAANEEASGAGPTFVSGTEDRDGTLGGAFSQSIRGFEPQMIPLPINFHTARSDFTPVGAAAARELVRALREQRPQKITIVGHADQRGGHDYNLRLSESRAKAVVKFLRDNGIKAAITPVGKGKTEPVLLSNTSGLTQEDIWALNRRVEWRRN
jgi:outer membrane protein OmpA-like peptidoglycan-associated protein